MKLHGKSKSQLTLNLVKVNLWKKELLFILARSKSNGYFGEVTSGMSEI